MSKLTRLSVVIGTVLGSAIMSQAAFSGEACNHAMKSAGYQGGYAPALYQVQQGVSGQYAPAQYYRTGMGYAANHGDMAEKAAEADIVDTAVAAGSFNTLVTAVKAAGLVETLKGQGPFTVFAPTDEAFAKLPKEQLNALLQDKAALTKVLTYHVVAGKVMASDVIKLNSAVTVEGQSVNISIGDGVKVNNSSVIKTDIATSNGVIHVIDTVMLPPDMSSAL